MLKSTVVLLAGAASGFILTTSMQTRWGQTKF